MLRIVYFFTSKFNRILHYFCDIKLIDKLNFSSLNNIFESHQLIVQVIQPWVCYQTSKIKGVYFNQGRKTYVRICGRHNGASFTVIKKREDYFWEGPEQCLDWRWFELQAWRFFISKFPVFDVVLILSKTDLREEVSCQSSIFWSCGILNLVLHSPNTSSIPILFLNFIILLFELF